MGYKTAYTEAKKAKKTADLTPKFIEWKEKGQQVVGRFRGRSEVASGLSSGTYYQYLFDTDEGLVKFALGAAADKELDSVLRLNHVYAITSLGKEEISGGRRVNKWKIEEVPFEDVEPVGGAGDEPI